METPVRFPRFAMGYAAIRNYFTASGAKGYRLVDKEESDENRSFKSEYYEVQRLVYDAGLCETAWRCVARLNDYSAACVVEEMERQREPLGTVVSTAHVHREILGWRVLRVTEEKWSRIAVRQMKSEVVQPTPSEEVK